MTKQNRSTIRNLVAQTFRPRVVAKIFPKFTLLAVKKIKRNLRMIQRMNREGNMIRSV